MMKKKDINFWNRTTKMTKYGIFQKDVFPDNEFEDLFDAVMAIGKSVKPKNTKQWLLDNPHIAPVEEEDEGKMR